MISRLLDSMKMSGAMSGNPRQTAGFAISDILELDRSNNVVGLESSINNTSGGDTSQLYPHSTQDLAGYVPSLSRHWASPPSDHHGEF